MKPKSQRPAPRKQEKDAGRTQPPVVLPARKSTIKDVARVAGVSLGTVSRVLNGSLTVGNAVHRKVMQAIEELNFVPSAAAQSMRRKSSLIVGCIVREISIAPLAEFVRASQTALDAAGYSLLLSISDGEEERERALLKRLQNRQVDGIILSPYTRLSQDYEAMLRGLGIPIVLVDRDKPDWADAVMVDHAHGVEIAVEHLLNLGHRKIALLTGPEDTFPAAQRVKGYMAAYKRNKVAVDPAMVRTGSYLATAGFQLASTMLSGKNRPTAIIAGGLSMLPGVLRAVQTLKLSVPEDVSIVGTGPSELSELHVPPISVQYWDHGETGRVAAMMLLDRMLKKGNPEPQRVLLPSTFISTRSIGPKPRRSSRAWSAS